MIFAFAALMLAQGASAPVQDDPGFCRVVQTVVAAAAEPEPFASLRGRPWADGAQYSSRVEPPGFEGYCSVAHVTAEDGAYGAALWCRRSLAPAGLTAAGLSEGVGRCLGLTPASGSEDRETLFETARYRIHIEEQGTDRAHVGRSVEVRVTARR
jgi:hypothetical protein